MRIHELDSRFRVLDDIEEARQFRPQTFMARHFGRMATSLEGAVHSSPILNSLAASFDYADLDKLPIGRETPFVKGSIKFKIARPDPAIDRLNALAADVGNYLEPLFGDRMHMAIYDQSPDREQFHVHPGMATAILPLGKDQLSTIWKNAQGRIITPGPDSLVVVGEKVQHASPAGQGIRAVMTISSFHRA